MTSKSIAPSSAAMRATAARASAAFAMSARTASARRPSIADEPRRFLDRGIDVDQPDIGAVAREPQRDGAADAARGAGDEGDSFR
ncbi:MAG: hypothetical protein V9G24_01350 [Rhodoblastus sp.]